MKRTRTPLVLLGLIFLGLIAALLTTYHDLPPHLATHFNSAGVPNGWMSRAGHLWMIAGLALGGSALLLGVFYCVRFVPASAINMPRRDHWLAPERRGETFDFLFRAGAWLACFEALFVLGLHLLLVAANATEPARLSSGVWILGGGFLAVTAVWMSAVFRHFYRVPK